MSDTVFKTKGGMFKLNADTIKLLVILGVVGGGSGLSLDYFRSTQHDDEIKHLEAQISHISSRQILIEELLSTGDEHTHVYGRWSKPVQMEGNFASPMFYQYQMCAVCGRVEDVQIK